MSIFSEKTDRRGYLKTSLGTGLALLLAACKTTKNRSAAADPSSSGIVTAPDDNPTTPPLTGISNNTSSGTTTGTGQSSQTDCQAPQIDLSVIAAATPNLNAQCFFYGNSTSALLVVSCPQYQYGILQSITILLQPSGRVVAQKGIFQASDIRPDTTLRPVTFENVLIKNDTQVVLLYAQTCSTCASGVSYSKFGPLNITYTTQFLGLPAYGLTPSAMPILPGGTSVQYSTYEAEPLFSPTLSSSSVVLQSGYNTVVPGIIQFQANGFTDLYVTDLAGNVLSTPGQPFTQIIEYPEFICYRLVGNYYIRTFVRVY